jgi:hypothetical protein
MPKDARALAGEWYRWFTERHTQKARAPTYWEDLRESVSDAVRDELLLFAPHDNDEVDDIWERSPEAREDLRPMLADWGEVAQFLHNKRLVLDEPSRKLFLDHLYGDFAAALQLLIRRAQGDYTPRRLRAPISEVRELARGGARTLATVRTVCAGGETRADDGEQVAWSIPTT